MWLATLPAKPPALLAPIIPLVINDNPFTAPAVGTNNDTVVPKSGSNDAQNLGLPSSTSSVPNTGFLSLTPSANSSI